MSCRVILIGLGFVAALSTARVLAQASSEEIDRFCAEQQVKLEQFAEAELKERYLRHGEEMARSIRLGFVNDQDFRAWLSKSGDSTMRAFAARYNLAEEFNSLITRQNHAEFWPRAELKLRERYSNEMVAEYYRSGPPPLPSTKCDPEKSHQEDGPLPLPYYPAGHALAGQPIMTDGLITGWIRSSYAAAMSGGAFWQAARFTKEDYYAVHRRIEAFLLLSNSQVELNARFSAEEIAALREREKDIRNAWTGNWPEVERM